MKQTPFFDRHAALGAKIVPFAGYQMPVYYTGINEEHLAVRHHAGLFDVSHMGEFILKGEGALDLIQRVTTNEASKLAAGNAQYSCMTNPEGGIIDDLLVYCLEPRKAYMLVVNASNIEKDWEWLGSQNKGSAEMHNISDKTCLLAVQGPLATRLLQPLTEIDLAGLKYYTFVKGRFAGVDNVLVSATGYTGAGGVEIYFEDKGGEAFHIWDQILSAGKQYGLVPAGLGARDTLRLEMGFCLYGNDIDDHTSPLEAGLGWITRFSKDFTGKEILEKQKSDGLSRRLVGFVLQEKGIPRHGYRIMDEQGRHIGEVTSGTWSPSLQQAIGLGYVIPELAVAGSRISVDIRGKTLKALVVKIPFVQVD
jgi:aminomethyltransferase